MRLKVRFADPQGKPVILPCNYNELVQSFIYKNLDEWLSKKIHDEGFTDPVTKRAFKLFTFSRLIPDRRAFVENQWITLYGNINLVVCSPSRDFVESFAINLLKSESFELGRKRFCILSVEVEGLPDYEERILVRTLSPITVYRTPNDFEGRKSTYYLSPFEREFEESLLENLRKKSRTFYGEDIKGGSIRPYKVSSKNQRILRYKGTIIKGWDGIFELNLPEKLFILAFETGLGAKNSQGFGCIEVWHKDMRKSEKSTNGWANAI
ncbi:MAG: CRISPR-associated endoribonuclease Cas6 [Desulfobacterota bacterium]|nr:CRISPR-associated endoribonuclease Cas6 [Thermodesulfobacteriota bacterium]MDW8002552.1 CRISPR-associated endoribonuclease Cas6 [Deltaproteobacteria bacterium]